MNFVASEFPPPWSKFRAKVHAVFTREDFWCHGSQGSHSLKNGVIGSTNLNRWCPWRSVTSVIVWQWYCWWFRNPARKPPFGWCWNPINNGINYHINWWVYRISEPSTVFPNVSFRSIPIIDLGVLCISLVFHTLHEHTMKKQGHIKSGCRSTHTLVAAFGIKPRDIFHDRSSLQVRRDSQINQHNFSFVYVWPQRKGRYFRPPTNRPTAPSLDWIQPKISSKQVESMG